MGQTQTETSANVDPPADRPLNIQQLVGFVKRDFEGNSLFKEAVYQTAGASVLRGATSFGDYFNQNYRAVITLFEGAANASTLVHESAHWLKGLMEALCTLTDGEGNYVASEGLREE